MYTEYLNNAKAWALEAGEILQSRFRSAHLTSQTKQNAFDVVTDADKTSESFLKEQIAKTYPDHAILGEESGLTGSGNAEWEWIIDPLDGTTNFSQGLPIFCVSIGLVHNGRPAAGVVYAPALGELFEASAGGGAFLNGKPIQCARKSELGEMVVATGAPYDRATNPDNNLQNILNVAPRVRGTRRMGSAAIDLCYTAAGFFDAYWELNIMPWDAAAGVLMVLEAGGVVRSLRENRNISIIAGSEETLAVFSPLIS